MRKLLQFVSLAILTQGILFLNQLILLPMQIRVWGHAGTAQWYTIVALAAIAMVADLGLRSAGHAELIRYVRDPNDRGAKLAFQQIWAWIRILSLIATILIIIFDLVSYRAQAMGSYPFWRLLLVIAFTLEGLLIVRIVYLDSMTYYREAEGGYLLMVGMRLFLAVAGLWWFHLPASGMAWIWFFTAAGALAHQGRLCGRLRLLRLFEAIPRNLSARTLAVARHTMATPFANWARPNLPVLVLSAIGSPTTVTTYIALRAAFGAAGTTIAQLSRFASVEYVQLKMDDRPESAEALLSAFVLFAAFFGTTLACGITADNLRIIGIWLAASNLATYQTMALLFGVSCAFCSSYIVLGLMLRMGEVAHLARRQYLYITLTGLSAIIGLVTRSLYLYLVLVALLAEIGTTAALMLAPTKNGSMSQTRVGSRGFVAGLVGSAFILVIWLAVRSGYFPIFQSRSLLSGTWTALVLMFWIGALALVTIYVNADVLKPVWAFCFPSIYPKSLDARRID